MKPTSISFSDAFATSANSEQHKSFTREISHWTLTHPGDPGMQLAEGRMTMCWYYNLNKLDLSGLTLPKPPPDLRACSALKEVTLSSKQQADWAGKLQLPAHCQIVVANTAGSSTDAVVAHTHQYPPERAAQAAVRQLLSPPQNAELELALPNTSPNRQVVPIPNALAASDIPAGSSTPARPISAVRTAAVNPLPQSNAASANAGSPASHRAKNWLHRQLERLPDNLYDPAPPPGTPERLVWRSRQLARQEFKKGRKEKPHFFAKNQALILMRGRPTEIALKGREAMENVRLYGTLGDRFSESMRQAAKHVYRKFVPKIDDTVQVAAFEDDLGNRVKTYGSAALNMESLELHQHDEFDEYNLSSLRNGCWWRAAWLAVLMDGQFAAAPGRLKKTILRVLGEDPETLELANHVDRLVQAMQVKEGWRPGYIQPRNILTPSPGRITLDNSSEVIEKTLVTLTKRLLTRAGMDAAEANALLTQGSRGENSHIFAILSQLGANGVIYHQPRPNPAEPKPQDPRKNWTCQVSFPPTQLPGDPDGQGPDGEGPVYPFRGNSNRETNENRPHWASDLAMDIGTRPVIMHRGGHFNLLISNIYRPPGYSPTQRLLDCGVHPDDVASSSYPEGWQERLTDLENLQREQRLHP